MSQVEDPFDGDIRADVDGLISLGALSNPNIEFCGHTFGLRTLRIDEDLASAIVIEPFRNTLKEPEAWAAAIVALALTHIDGEEDFCPQTGPDKVAYAQARYRYVTSKWFQPTLDFLFEEYNVLLEKQAQVTRAVQDLSSRSRPTFSPLPDFLNEPGTSEESINSDSP